MKKSLLATVAAVALIAGTGFASAEGAKDQPKAGQAEMNKGADVKGGAAIKSKSETIGAGAEIKAEPKADMKTDTKANADKAKPSTTGQGADQKTNPSSRPSAEEKSSPAKANEATPGAKSSTNEKAAPAAGSSAQGTQAPAAKSSAQGTQSGAQPSGSVNLTTDQKAKIRTSVIQSSSAPRVSRSSINFNISVGTVVPRSVKFVSVPATIVEYYPAYRGHSYFIVDDEIIIVDARTLKIIAVISV